ncbi:MAG: choice-of-anchor F family protein [Hydrogenovibrio crunogenus]|nr:choice-of-anchor F family protein [Hydrogenovibrio crunogenus]
MVDGETFSSVIDDGAGNITGKLTSKVWPVGEPAGVKVLTDTDTIYENNGKPASCIMSTAYHTYDDGGLTPPSGAVTSDGFLDSTYPNPTMCDSAFQTHKRFKVSAQPAALTAGGIDMVFNVSDSPNAEGAAQTRYMVLQKLNNYTGKHLSGFKIQVGTGVGASFTAIGTGTTVELSDGIGEKTGGGDIWGEEDRAAFSAGLFGPADPPKHPDPGFFDQTNRAGFNDAENANKDQIASTGALTSAYTTLFGGSKWLPGKYMPTGIFFDDDNNPDTDDQLVAWWGDNPNTSIQDHMWLKGAADSYAPLSYIELNA